MDDQRRSPSGHRESATEDPPRNPLRRAAYAPAPRTLVDILQATAHAHPDEPAIDNGREVLTYAEVMEAATEVARALGDNGVGTGDRVGIQIPSGTTDLYVAIIGTLVAGAAYVPVDFDDPPARAETVFGEAGVAAIIEADLVIRPTTDGPPEPVTETDPPQVTDDAWIIFTSGSTGTPKGVAVTHRNAAAFVDAESRLFLQDRPIGPGDRVMAGLSVAFDASCEEMWLAWRYGACLVPAPRSLVKSGMDLGPWLTANGITVVSTVPTLVSLWPENALANVRLLILGGEACPPEIADRLANATREVWNTYGPTEATVVACGAQLHPGEPVRIGLPLDGWDLAVVDPATGIEVAEGEDGELVIGGVGLARYLDPVKDAAVYAAMPTLGWERAYRSGDVVRNDPAGLFFRGRADDQVKVGGRRIELGEIDSALLALPGVSGAAAAVRTSGAGNKLLVGYLALDPAAAPPFDRAEATARLRASMPAALVPRLAVVDDLPVRTSGKIDRDALPWPLPGADAAASVSPEIAALGETATWVAGLWQSVLGAPAANATEDFFDAGGGSLMAAQLVARLRERYPEATVADVYGSPTVAGIATAMDAMDTPTTRRNDTVRPVQRKTQQGQLLATVAVRAVGALRWLSWIGLGNLVARTWLGITWLPHVALGWVVAGWLLFLLPPGRMAVAALAARLILRGIQPGSYPRGGKVHLRVWLAERLADELGATNLSGAGFIKPYARWLGNDIGRDVDLHTVPPVTGLASIGDGAAIEIEVDLRTHWLDGDRVHLGPVRVGREARVGARSSLLPGADVGARAEVAPGSTVMTALAEDTAWSGSPARQAGAARGPWSSEVPPRRPGWLVMYAASAVVIALLPVVAAGLAALLALPSLRTATGLGNGLLRALAWLPLVSLVALVLLAGLIVVLVRLLSIGLRPGHHPVQSRQAWQAWATMRVLDEARTWLFPLYSSWLTPTWLRALGATIGHDVEASTVLLIPTFTEVRDGAFLADDTLVAGYELAGGWLRVERVRVGKRAFVGNSGMAAPGRKVPKQGLVAVLSAAPQRRRAKAGTSWVGSPPEPLRREASTGDTARTYQPPTRLKVMRAGVESARIVAVWAHLALMVLVVGALEWLLARHTVLAVLLGAIPLLVAGAVAAGVTAGAKWLLVGRFRPGDHPLWSSFVWRSELADTFVEVLAAPWLARAATGTFVLNTWLRLMGAKIGRGVWVETYWLPEADLIDLRDGATVGAGCVVQTHLFHDRVLSMDTVTLAAGGTLGPNSVILPAARIGRHATVGPGSLVMRGEQLPDRTRWIGNPVGPWLDEEEDPA